MTERGLEKMVAHATLSPPFIIFVLGVLNLGLIRTIVNLVIKN
jgi:hypothetical protein